GGKSFQGDMCEPCHDSLDGKEVSPDSFQRRFMLPRTVLLREDAVHAVIEVPVSRDFPFQVLVKGGPGIRNDHYRMRRYGQPVAKFQHMIVFTQRLVL